MILKNPSLTRLSKFFGGEAKIKLDADRLDPVHKLWILRSLVTLSGHKCFLTKTGFSDDALAIALGLQKYVDDVKIYDASALVKILKEMLKEVEKATPQEHKHPDNYETIVSLLNLSNTETYILRLVVLLHTNPVVVTAIDTLHCVSLTKLHHIIAVITNQTIQCVRQSLSPGSALIRSGLVAVDCTYLSSSISCSLDILSNNFAYQIESEDFDFVSQLNNFMIKAPTPNLELKDYSHINPTLDILLPYLRHALANRSKGVNICIYGPPGTGKTELCGAISKALNANLYTVSNQDESGPIVGGSKRLRSVHTAQKFLTGQRALLLFDEMEDVFNDGGAFAPSTADKNKSWINRTLEENDAPTFWVSNTIHIDRAFIRRFDLTLELSIPPRQKRQQIIQNACGGILDKESIAQLATIEHLSPAIVNRSAKVVLSVKDDIPGVSTNQALKTLIEGTLKAQGHGTLKQLIQNRVPSLYDTHLMNADADMAAVATGLARHPRGRMCLYGPPGTGKTAYGLWLANELGIPLHLKKGSDLISMWIGETEKNIAEAFDAAEQDNALLLIDEVDSFLQDRRGAQRSWEVTAVNEMLTQMERFDGIFIASTNLMASLDQASLRRFDLKVKFDYLRPDQAWTLYSRHCDALGLDGLPDTHRHKISALDILTPGDFATVSRQANFKQFRCPEDFLLALETECLVKEEGRTRRMGFV